MRGGSLDSLFWPRPPIKKRIMLKADELRTVLATLDTLRTENALAFRILLATCVRTSELISAKWKDIDLENGSWYVPDATTKTRTGFYVPLMPPVVEWFRQLLVLSGSSAYVLPARTSSHGAPACIFQDGSTGCLLRDGALRTPFSLALSGRIPDCPDRPVGR
jgi:integrase